MSNTAPTLTVTTATADHAQHKPAQTRKPPPSFDRRLEFAGVAEAQLAQVVRYIISLSISKLYNGRDLALPLHHSDISHSDNSHSGASRLAGISKFRNSLHL